MSESKRRLPLSILKPATVLIFALMVVLIVFPLIGGSYYTYLLMLIGIGILLALGLNIFFGYCGQINFGAAGFYAIGGYAYMLLQTKLGLNFLLALPIALVFTAIVALAVSVPLLRLRHHVLALGTVAFALVIYYTLDVWYDFTGGGNGIFAPKPTLFGFAIGHTFNYYFILISAVVGFLICHYLISSRVGRAFKAIREDETAARAMGIDVSRYMRLAFLLNALFCGMAGILYAQQSGWLTPEIFGLWENIIILIMVVVGGAGSNVGAAIGGTIIILLPEFLSGMEDYFSIAYGVLLLLVVLFMPAGVVGVIKRLIPYLARFWGRLATARAGILKA